MRCDCPTQRIVYVHPSLLVYICDNPKCAKIVAKCEHVDCTWNDELTVLTCTFCGIDAT